VRTARVSGLPGSSALTVRGGGLKSGRYSVLVEARDAAGNRAVVQRAVVRIAK
jgi:hypothetical protein